MKTLKLLKATLFTLAVITSISGFSQDKMKKGKMMNEKTVMVGGAEMYPSKNIIENAVKVPFFVMVAPPTQDKL